MAIDPVSLAVTAALTAANMAITASQTIEGPRLEDLSVTVADYGTPLPYVYGIRRVEAPCFYAERIRERKKRRKTKGGKYNDYTYFGTWASLACDHPISGVRKIWFDRHLVYSSVGGEETFPLADDYELASALRIYTGGEDQEPDDRMLATIEARDGPGTCPAYRGVSYVFFEDIPLEKIGNRLPQVSIEVASAAGAPEYVEFEFDLPDALTNWGLGWDDVEIGGGDGPYMEDITDPMSVVLSPDSTFTLEVGDYTGLPEDEDEPLFYALRGEKAGTFILRVYRGFRGVDTPGFPNPLPVTVYGLATDWDEVDNLTITVRQRLPGEDWVTLSASADEAPYTTTISGSEVVVKEMVFDNAEWDGPGSGGGGGGESAVTLGSICADVAERCGLDAGDYDFTALDQPIYGYSWTQGTGRQIAEPPLSLFDSDTRPHDFTLQGIKRGASPSGTIATPEFVAGENRYTLERTGDSDLPRRMWLTFSDIDADQQPNTVTDQRRAASVAGVREQTIEMTNLALTADEARQLVGRQFRRAWFQRIPAELGLTRQQLALEPCDVTTLDFDGDPLIMECRKLTLGADGVLRTEWKDDDPALAVLPGTAGAPAAGHVPDTIFDPVDTQGEVLDLPLLSDAHDQATPFVYLAAGPVADGDWSGADFAHSDTGETGTFASGWDGLASSEASLFGVMSDALPDAPAGVIDNGSSVEVVLNFGELDSISETELLNDGALNLALIGDELVQFQTATLTAPLTYALSGFVRGARGTERFIGSHGATERFVLLDGGRIHTLGASEIGDEDEYVAATLGALPDEADAQALEFTAQAHRPYSPVHGVATLAGGDWSVTAIRRTRVGGSTLNGQDVPLGEASESWALDIMDGASVVRTITGAALPLVYTAAMQATDGFTPAAGAFEANLYQVNPTLNLRGAGLNITG